MSNLMNKQSLTDKQLHLVQSEFLKQKKSKGIAYALWWFTGILGGHRFYAGDKGIGIAMLLTLGGFGIWALIDVFFIGGRIEQRNDEIEDKLIDKVRAYGA